MRQLEPGSLLQDRYDVWMFLYTRRSVDYPGNYEVYFISWRRGDNFISDELLINDIKYESGSGGWSGGYRAA